MDYWVVLRLSKFIGKTNLGARISWNRIRGLVVRIRLKFEWGILLGRISLELVTFIFYFIAHITFHFINVMFDVL